MSPEQADISATDVDTRADVYSLGVLLYELLTGTTPFEREKFRAASLDEIRRTIREEEPPRPSARVTTLRATCTSTCPRCRGEPRRLIQTLRGELDWIVMKALEKDRTRRYQSARELAEDVRRYLGNEAVQACPPSKPYRLRKLAARHKAALATLSLVAASLLAGTAVSIWQAMEADAARKLADARAEDERRARIEASEREASLRRELYATDVNVAWHFWEEGDKRRCLELLDRHRPRGDQADLRGFEWHYLSTLARKKWTILTGHQAPLLTADALPDGRLVAGADRSGVVKVWDPATGHELQTLRYGTLEVSCVRFSPDGRRLATAGQDRLIHLWDVATSAETARLAGHELTICSIAWSPDGRMIASAARDHSVRVWDVENQGEARLLSGHTDVVRSVAWSPDGKLLASGGADLTVRLWDTVSWRPAGDLGGHNEGLLAVAFSPDGRWLASAGYNTSIIIHDVARRKELARIPQPGNVWSLAFAPDSRLLAVGRNEGRLSLYQIDDHAGKLSQLRSEIDFTGAIRAVVFAQAGETLVLAVEEDQAIGSGRVASLTGRQGRSFSGDSLAADFDRDLVATADPAGTILLRSFRAGDVLTRIAVHGARVLDAAFAPRAEVLASCSIDGSVCLSSTRTGEVLHRLEVAEPPVRSLAFSADGALLAGSGDKGAVNLWQTESGELIRTLKAPEGSPAAVAFAPDGKVLATGSYGKIALWETCAGRRLAVLESHLKGTSDLAFSPDGSLLAACGDSHVSLWDLSTGREAAILMGHRGSVYGAAFSPDGRTLATLGQDETVRLWQVATRRELFALARFNRPPTWLCFASSGALLVGTAADEQGSSEVLVFGASR
jgi:WD40 repeat protein